MPEKGFKPNFDKVLAHLSDYGVVVCRLCRFAVQPKALPSHLLRHQIYRDERRQLLHECGKLGLREPEEVVNPPANAKSLPFLSVQRGFRCEAKNCDHACVSSKRMSQHWSESHNESDSRNVEAKPVYLQTFFRGNKIRYFEVNGPGNGQLEPNELHRKNNTTTRAAGDEGTPPADLSSVSNGSIQMSWESPSHESCSPLEDEQPLVHLDIDNLQYFHHYLAETCLTLRRGDTESSTFWRSDIVKEAFKYPFLMYGILGVAAAHLTMLNIDNLPILETHRQASLRYQQSALFDFRSAMREPDTQNSTALIAFGRVIGVQTGVQHQLVHIYPHLAPTSADPTTSTSNNPGRRHPCSIARILEIFHLLRGVGEMLLSFQPLLPHGSDFLLSEEILEGLRDHHISCSSSSYSPPSFPSSSSPEDSLSSHPEISGAMSNKFLSLTLEDLSRRVPVPVVEKLVRLKERLAPLMLATYPPEEWSQTLNLDAAVETLKVAYAQSYITSHASCSSSSSASISSSSMMTTTTTTTAANDASWARWNGAEGWLRRAPENYVRMLSSGDPAALVVFAYWCPLLKRLEGDYWFLKGQAECLGEIVLENMPGEEWRELVRGLL